MSINAPAPIGHPLHRQSARGCPSPLLPFPQDARALLSHQQQLRGAMSQSIVPTKAPGSALPSLPQYIPSQPALWRPPTSSFLNTNSLHVFHALAIEIFLMCLAARSNLVVSSRAANTASYQVAKASDNRRLNNLPRAPCRQRSARDIG